uniref:Secreted protein n=1 Tax=Macrostomum lignano TaxID=282301 RepID=A0A1I8F9C9_9PLAT
FFWYLRTVVIRLKSSSLHLVVLTRLSTGQPGERTRFRTCLVHTFLPLPVSCSRSESAWSPGAPSGSWTRCDFLDSLRRWRMCSSGYPASSSLGPRREAKQCLLKFVLAIILPTIIIAKADSVPEPIDKSECYNYIRTNPTACNLQWNYFDGSCRCKRCAPYLAQIMRTRTSGRSIKLSRLKRFGYCALAMLSYSTTPTETSTAAARFTPTSTLTATPKAAHRNRWTFSLSVYFWHGLSGHCGFADLAIRCDSVLSLRSKQNLAAKQFRLVDSSSDGHAYRFCGGGSSINPNQW